MDKILVVDDDKRINELMVDIFTMEGFNVLSAFDGEQAIEILNNVKGISVVLLDVMMPKVDGWATLAYIKARFDAKVIMLTALDEEENEVKGIRSGADDYISKPFKRGVLLERVKRFINNANVKPDVRYISGPLVVSVGECRAFLDEVPIKLTTKELNLLVYLMENNKKVLTREEMLDKVWGYRYDVNDRTIDTHIKMIRHNLGDYGYVIRTARGIGYSFDAEVTVR